MSTRRPSLVLALAFALLAGQWLAAAHEPDHALQPGAAHGCVVCITGHGAGAGALPAAPQLLLESALPVPVAAPVASPLAAATRHHPIRGPPQLPG